MISVDSLLVIVVVFVVIFFVGSFARILREYERAVIFRLGRRATAILNPGGNGNGPGLVLLLPLLDRMVKVSMQTVALDVPPQDVITRDNVSIKVSAVIYFRVIDPDRAVIAVQDYLYATSQIAQTTLRSVLGQVELDDLLSARDKINQQLQRIIDEHTEPWGIKVATVEVKQIDLPQDMQRAMAKQAEAERERRAKIINAQGELQASETLAQAARMLQSQPASLQLRYLQTVTEIAAENNSTTIFPIPIEMLRPFFQRADDSIAAKTPEGAGLPPAVAPSALATPNPADALPQFRVESSKKPANK
jgi:regulator of protease activity HflC (stomatin/prohibitin superfamily)